MEIASRREGVTPDYLFLADGIVNTEALGTLSNPAVDSFAYEEILRNTIKNLYISSHRGNDNYSGKNPDIGTITFSRCREIGLAQLGLCVANNGGWRIDEIATINLRERTYSLPKYNSLRYEVLRDTKKVMEVLGLIQEEHTGKMINTKHW